MYSIVLVSIWFWKPRHVFTGFPFLYALEKSQVLCLWTNYLVHELPGLGQALLWTWRWGKIQADPGHWLFMFLSTLRFSIYKRQTIFPHRVVWGFNIAIGPPSCRPPNSWCLHAYYPQVCPWKTTQQLPYYTQQLPSKPFLKVWVPKLLSQSSDVPGLSWRISMHSQLLSLLCPSP